MKKLFISFMALLCTLGAFAQSTAENINQPKAMKPIIMVVQKKLGASTKGLSKMATRNRQITRRPCSTTMFSMLSPRWVASCKNVVIL